MPGFCGSATEPCGSCFAPQSAPTRRVASALSSGRHSEEPRVVVTKGGTDRTKFDGAQPTVLGCVFLVTICDFSAKQGRNLEFRAPCREGCWPSRRRRTAVPSDTQSCRKKSCSGRSVPSLSSFQGCERPLVLQALQNHDRHTIDARAPALQASPATCVSLRRPPTDRIPVFKVGQ